LKQTPKTTATQHLCSTGIIPEHPGFGASVAGTQVSITDLNRVPLAFCDCSCDFFGHNVKSKTFQNEALRYEKTQHAKQIRRQ